MLKASVTFFIILLNSAIACADVSRVMVMGLFKDVVVLEVDKKQHIIRTGHATPEGIKLISATSEFALLEINGIREQHYLGAQVGSQELAPAEQPIVSIWPTRGMYLTPGSINGYSVDFLVDTGASDIALNAITAKRLDIDFLEGKTVSVQTAVQVEKAYRVNLDQVQVGNIMLYNISALVIDGPEPARALLGMSFLGQLDMVRSDDRMDLQQKF